MGKMKGLTGLAESRKGVTFSVTFAAIAGMAVQGSISPDLGAKLLALLAAAHIIGQGLADIGKKGSGRA